MFNTQGKFLTRFGEEWLNGPESIEVDKDCFVYVADGCVLTARLVLFSW